jgi:hypothetical protein
MSRRVLTVTIGTSHIEQGDVSPPRVGSIIEILLDFVETDDPPPAEATTVRAVLELNPTPRLDGHERHPDGRYWLWFGELFGEGWRATWLGRRPKTGSVTVTGRFYPSRGLAYKRGSHGQVRGRVTRVQVQTIPYHCPDGEWRPLPGAPRSYRDVTLAPRWFDRSGLCDPEHDRTALVWADSNVIIDLDLDDVPARAPRPKIEPGDVTIGDHGIWVVDDQLPVVALLSGDTATEYVFPGTITSGRVLRATPDGCLIFEGGDIYRCVVNEPIMKTANTVPGITSGDTSMRFEQTDGVNWRVVLTSSAGRRTEVDAIEDGYVPVGSVVDGTSFVVAVRDHTSADKPTSLVRITTAGRVTMGPAIASDRRDYEKRITLVNNPLRMIQSHAVIPIRENLSPGDPVVLHQFSLRAGQAGDIVWIVAHPPSGQRRGQDPWWPLPGQIDYDTSRGQFWLLTLFDANSRPTGSYPISTVSPGVAIDPNGDVWITDRGLRRLPAEPMAWSNPIDLDEAITRTIAPAIAGGDGSS